MVLQIESGLYERQGKTVNNFTKTLAVYDSDLAKEVFKSPYIFDFLQLSEQAKEKELELGLIVHLKNFMLELGRGFAYFGNQFKLEVEGNDFFLDLLFYNARLHCYVVFELKIGDFKPEYAGKLNFYLNAVDEQIKTQDDKPTIGILLCKTPNKTVVEYALRGIEKPMGVADFELKKYLPADLESKLPTVSELEAEIETEIQEFKEAQSPVDERLQAIKEKIKNINTDELQMPATFKVLSQLYKNGLRVLYVELMEKVKIFDEYFYSKSFHWNCSNNNFTELAEVDEFWKVEENIIHIFNFNFHIQLEGFKKAGTEYGNASITFTFRIDTYYYSFTIVNHNNQEPFLKKLYHQPLKEQDRANISNVMMTIIMDEIDRILERIKQNENE